MTMNGIIDFCIQRTHINISNSVSFSQKTHCMSNTKTSGMNVTVFSLHGAHKTNIYRQGYVCVVTYFEY